MRTILAVAAVVAGFSTTAQAASKKIDLRTKEGVAAIVLDLNAIGHNLERDQCYYSLILQIARKLNIRNEIKAW